VIVVRRSNHGTWTQSDVALLRDRHPQDVTSPITNVRSAADIHGAGARNFEGHLATRHVILGRHQPACSDRFAFCHAE
jgi:hypothetical protein